MIQKILYSPSKKYLISSYKKKGKKKKNKKTTESATYAPSKF